MNSQKPKKIVITPEEVANSPSRKSAPIPSRKAQTSQVLELNPETIENASGVTFIQVNELGEVSTIDESLLEQGIF